MQDKNLAVLFCIVALAIIFLYILSRKRREGYSKADAKVADQLAKQLESKLSAGETIDEVSEEDLEKMIDRVLLVKKPDTKSNNTKEIDSKENFSYHHGQNSRGFSGRNTELKGGWRPQDYEHNYYYGSATPYYYDLTSPSYYNYAYPYSYYYPADAWPPNLYSNLYNWSPGFYTNGFSWYLRPQLVSYYPRGRWLRNNGSYYYVY
jgi:hypothetical protein